MPDEAKTDGNGGEIERLKDEFAAEMAGLRRRQRAAVEKALKAVDAKRIEKVRKTLDDIER